MNSLPGTSIDGRYEVDTLLGVGGMSSVYRVRDIALGTTVALKMMHPHITETRSNIDRFLQEAKAEGLIHHPNVIAVRNVSATQEGQLYLIMDYLEGQSLSEFIHDEPLRNQKLARDIFVQICNGMEAAHTQGVIHRDMKPSNVMIIGPVDAPLVKIVDFGIAKLVTKSIRNMELTKAGAVLGSPSYMSPEQCDARPLDARSDIYSLGCLMFEVLTGRVPFDAESDIEVMIKHVAETPHLVSDVAPWALPDFDFIVDKCLKKTLVERYQSVAELRADLESIEFDDEAVENIENDGAETSSRASGSFSAAGRNARSTGNLTGRDTDKRARQTGKLTGKFAKSGTKYGDKKVWAAVAAVAFIATIGGVWKWHQIQDEAIAKAAADKKLAAAASPVYKYVQEINAADLAWAADPSMARSAYNQVLNELLVAQDGVFDDLELPKSLKRVVLRSDRRGLASSMSVVQRYIRTGHLASARNVAQSAVDVATKRDEPLLKGHLLLTLAKIDIAQDVRPQLLLDVQNAIKAYAASDVIDQQTFERVNDVMKELIAVRNYDSAFQLNDDAIELAKSKSAGPGVMADLLLQRATICLATDRRWEATAFHDKAERMRTLERAQKTNARVIDENSFVRHKSRS